MLTFLLQEIVLQDAPSWKGEDGTQLVGGWDRVVQADFSHNYIKEIDSSMVMTLDAHFLFGFYMQK